MPKKIRIMVKEEIHQWISTFFYISGLILYISKWSWMYYVAWSGYFLFVASTILQVYYKYRICKNLKLALKKQAFDVFIAVLPVINLIILVLRGLL